MTRYTKKMLQADLEKINARLLGTGFYLEAQSRNGYTGIDEYFDDVSKGHAGNCTRNIATGTPTACLKAALAYVPPEPPRSLAGTQKSPFGPF